MRFIHIVKKLFPSEYFVKEKKKEYYMIVFILLNLKSCS